MASNTTKGVPAAGAADPTPAATDEWSPLTWNGDPKYPWTVTLAWHIIGILSLAVICVAAGRDTAYGEGDPKTVLGYVGIIVYVVWLFGWYWPRHITAQYRWYWVRASDFCVVSDVGDAPNVEANPGLGFREQRRRAGQLAGDRQVLDSVALRICIHGIGRHAFVWMGGRCDVPPKIAWKVRAFDGTTVTMRDRLRNAVVVTPQLALRIAQFPDLGAYAKSLSAEGRVRAVDEGRIARIRLAGRTNRSTLAKHFGETLDVWKDVLWNVDSALWHVLNADESDRARVIPEPDLVPVLSVGHTKVAGELVPPRVAPWLAWGMHALAALALAGLWVGSTTLYRTMSSGSVAEASNMVAALGWIVVLFTCAMFTIGYAVWFPLLYYRRNLRTRERWHWVCATCGGVTTDAPPTHSTPTDVHRVAAGTRVIRERVSGCGKDSSALLGPGDSDVKGAEWTIIGARAGRIVLQHGITADRRIAELPPSLALRVVQRDGDPHAYWLACEEGAQAMTPERADADALAASLREAQHAIRDLRLVSDETVFNAEFVHVDRCLATLAGEGE